MIMILGKRFTLIRIIGNSLLASMVCLFTSLGVSAGSWQQNVAAGGFNNVHIYTPDTQSPIGEGRALLVVLHGCTQSISAYLSANLEEAAESYGMVIAVPDAMNKAGFSCWSYWQGAKSRSAGDYANLLSLANTLTADSSYGIDADQVYIAGLSSGAAFANTTACLAPDVFAGMGISAGPSIGTSSSGAIGSCEYADVATRCQQYAGSYTASFDDQIASIAHGDADTTVDTCYNRQNAEGMADVYGVSELAGNSIIGATGRTAEEVLWQEGRVSMLWLNGVDHAWSGGDGASGSYINGSGINYASYLGQFFIDNNKRVDRNQAPVLSGVTAQESGGQLIVQGSAVDEEGSVDQINVLISDNIGNAYQYTAIPQSDDRFLITSAALADALYVVSVTAVDNEGAVSAETTLTARVGPPPPPIAPVISNAIANVSGQCAAVSGDVYDENEDLTNVIVSYSTGDISATIEGLSFSATACDLPGGQQNITITANDAAGLSSNTQLNVFIDAGVTATLSEHISAGRLGYTEYATCYLEYGTDTFKLTEAVQSDGNCIWQDNDVSCFGVAQSCSTGGGNNGGGNGGSSSCVEFTTSNYYHKVAGRAYSTGNLFAPDYFANGSDDAMLGSTWGTVTLYSNNDTLWYVGACPSV
ncbi:extracellular catalytic domain type 1 short-chain-length polyhydroxyalkanoate depolymerase [Alteromonas lipotrueae]|uniref:extracellular catalytic domain type 1 short-chain-length polyhydroxyalkanoate depolymerase n=1 Tax=Alteromonas lipotrueae TaxID=2803814 RepID=UPI00215C9A7E|nr:PHB depolymerase family esterase [Alteromonas lipotrueae]